MYVNTNQNCSASNRGRNKILERGAPGNCELLKHVAIVRMHALFFFLFMKLRGPPKGGGGV